MVSGDLRCVLWADFRWLELQVPMDQNWPNLERIFCSTKLFKSGLWNFPALGASWWISSPFICKSTCINVDTLLMHLMHLCGCINHLMHPGRKLEQKVGTFQTPRAFFGFCASNVLLSIFETSSCTSPKLVVGTPKATPTHRNQHAKWKYEPTFQKWMAHNSSVSRGLI